MDLKKLGTKKANLQTSMNEEHKGGRVTPNDSRTNCLRVVGSAGLRTLCSQFQKTTLLIYEVFLIFKLLKLLLWRSFGCVKLLLVKTFAILLWRSDVVGKVILT